MKKIEKLLIPTDLSRVSLSAIDYALPLALHSRATIYLIHIIDEPSVMAKDTTWNRERSPMMCSCTLQNELEDYFFGQFRRYEKIVYIIRRGEASAEILRFAGEESIDVIVMATHGRAGCREKTIGSITEYVLQHCTIPVILVQSKNTPAIIEHRKDDQR